MSRVWFITGSSRGLGLAITEAALAAGDRVIATARNPSTLDALVSQYGSDRILPLTLDVSDNAQVLAAVKAGHEKFARIDVVVNNAGYANTVSVEDVLPILRAQKSGYIFQVSSLGGRIGVPGLSAYQSAKWAVGGFSTVLAQEVAPFGIKVTVLEPGGIRTEWAGSSMNIPTPSEPYKRTVGAFSEFLRGTVYGSEPSLPEKIAEIIFKLLGEEEPPLRLLVGPDAVDYAEKAAQGLAENDAKWRELSISSA
jgi:NAD(P)-dependent dehydrogenase (short-subunit alcohol dehydrogenase family)